MSERLADDLRDRDSLLLLTVSKQFLEFRIEPHGLDGRGCRASASGVTPSVSLPEGGNHQATRTTTVHQSAA